LQCAFSATLALAEEFLKGLLQHIRAPTHPIVVHHPQRISAEQYREVAAIIAITGSKEHLAALHRIKSFDISHIDVPGL